MKFVSTLFISLILDFVLSLEIGYLICLNRLISDFIKNRYNFSESLFSVFPGLISCLSDFSIFEEIE